MGISAGLITTLKAQQDESRQAIPRHLCVSEKHVWTDVLQVPSV